VFLGKGNSCQLIQRESSLVATRERERGTPEESLALLSSQQQDQYILQFGLRLRAMLKTIPCSRRQQQSLVLFLAVIFLVLQTLGPVSNQTLYQYIATVNSQIPKRALVPSGNKGFRATTEMEWLMHLA